LKALSGAKLRLIFAMAAFGTIGIFVRLIPLPSSVIALVRGALGALFLLAVSYGQKKPPDRKAIAKNLRYLLPSGIIMGFNWVLLFEAYRYTTVAIATLCYYFSPVIILLLSPLMLKEKLTRTVSVDELAKTIHMPVSTFKRKFQHAFTLSPMRYFDTLRIEKIVDLICKTDWPISKIARHVGFDNKYYFAKFFAKHLHVTPEEYAETFRSGNA